MKAFGAVLLAAATLIAAPAGARAASFSYVPVTGAFVNPANAAVAPGDPTRLFVVERAGRVFVVKDERKIEVPFLDLRSEIPTPTNSASEHGLMSIAFAPDYATSRRFYVFFAELPDGDTVVREYRTSATNPDVADPASGRDVLSLQHHKDGATTDEKQMYDQHYGGQLQFGPDGLLYVSIGDGADGDGQEQNSQNLSTLHGKLLRIDPLDPDGTGPATYGVPGDNPYINTPGAQPEIWMWGLRNAYRFSFDPVTSDLALGDVGGSLFEELDVALAPAPGVVGGAGNNWGWPRCEGFIQPTAPSSACHPAFSTTALPVVARSHSADSAHAITAGAVVRDPGLPSLYGRLLYGDAIDPRLRSIALRATPGDRAEPDLPAQYGAVAIVPDACQRIYIVRLLGAPAGQQVVRLQEGASATPCPAPVPPPPPVIPTPRAPLPATWSASIKVAISAGSKLRASRSGRLRLTIRNTNNFAATGTMTVKAVKKTVGRSSVSLAADQKKTTLVRLSKRGRTMLVSRKKLRVTVQLTLKDPAGKSRSTSRTLRLRAPAPLPA